MPKTHLLEPSEESFWRRRAVQPATLAGLGTRDAIAEVPEMPQRRVFENKAAVVPPPLLPRAIEPKEEAALAVSMSEAARLERKHMTEFEHSVPVTEPAHETSVAEVPEVPPHEGLRLPKEALVEHGATVSQAQLRASVS